MYTYLKRIGIDSAGYLLILLGVVSGWLPGPGGIPLILGGLGLLSLNNSWARRWRVWLVKHSGDFIKWVFPKHTFVQDLYDLLAVLLILLVTVLIWEHAAIWQISLASILFFVAMTIVGFNRDRASNLRLKVRGGKKEPAKTSHPNSQA